ncbi:SRPBCC family protein [Prochlorococcus marinus]|uniref:Coenzyme Q-binding protein COQ10 START domain-containing protein n=1 Tax=Prochlorococcus marinus (strain MIT 9211) TaxID=93059 RepID=A9BB31_PROM4|nr:conserved hypothetical protein [Prochlorococcus marinus str. MIT 9211]
MSQLDFNERTIEQTMEVLPGGTRRLAAQLRTRTNFDALWNVLTNYDHLSEFIPNLASSKLVFRDENRIHLRQVGSQEFFGFTFSAEVLLELIENKADGILKFSLLEGDFRRFEGSWAIKQSASGQGSSIIYELIVQGCFGMPVSLIEDRLRIDLTNNLLAVEKASFEMLAKSN